MMLMMLLLLLLLAMGESPGIHRWRKQRQQSRHHGIQKEEHRPGKYDDDDDDKDDDKDGDAMYIHLEEKEGRFHIDFKYLVPSLRKYDIIYWDSFAKFFHGMLF